MPITDYSIKFYWRMSAMSELAQWLSEHMYSLVQAASVEMASNEQLQAIIGESVVAFYEALKHSVQVESMIPLRAILIDWVEVRSAPTEEEPTGLLPVLT